MARAIIGVIVGYVGMFILNFLGFVTLYAVIGPDQAFEPGLYLRSANGSGRKSVLAHLDPIHFPVYQRVWRFARRKIEAARLINAQLPGGASSARSGLFG